MVDTPPAIHRSIVIAIFILLLAFAVNIASGSVSIPWLSIFFTPRSESSEELVSLRFIVSLRLIHAGAAFCVGSALALTGAVLQRLLRNPLGDPFVLGVTSGGTFFAVATMVLGMPFLLFGIPVRMIAGLFGSILSLGALLAVRRFVIRSDDAYAVPVAGMMLNALFGALLLLALVFADPSRISEAQRWLLGDIQAISLHELAAVAVLVISAGFALIRLSPAIGALAFGEDFARSLGFNTAILKHSTLLLCAVLTAAVVSIAGSVGFVGLVVPHLARWFVRSHLAAEWIVSALLGGALVLIADAFARGVAAPTELPVGIFTAIIGVPALCIMAIRAGGNRDSGT